MEPTSITGDAEAIAGRRRRRVKQDTLPVIYLAASFGALCLGLGDLLNNDNAATVLKLGEVMRKNFYPELQSGGLLALVLLVSLGAGTCWIHQPTSRIDAFSRGFSVFAILAVVTPYQSSPPQQAPLGSTNESATNTTQVPRNYSMIALAAMQLPDDTENSPPSESLGAQQEPMNDNSAVIMLQSLRDAPIKKTIVTVRDLETAQILGYQAVVGDTFSLSLPEGEYLLELEVPGYRRTNFSIELGEGPSGYSVPMTTSIFPLSLQRLIGAQEVKPEEFAPTPRTLRLGARLSFR